MHRLTLIALAVASALAGSAPLPEAARAQVATRSAAERAEAAGKTESKRESLIVARLGSRYPTLATQPNIERLVRGLHAGASITLVASTDGGTVTLASPTGPMSYRDIARTMTLATRQLKAAGVTDPSPQDLKTALLGGTLASERGAVAVKGVLLLRSRGAAWSDIARAVGAPPGKNAGRSALVAAYGAASPDAMGEGGQETESGKARVVKR